MYQKNSVTLQSQNIDMEVEVKKAVQIFFSNASFEMIYMEAFANALDAGANEFKITISANSTNPKDLYSLSIKFWDNGVGFDDFRFGKFSKLLSVEDRAHKGLGRLVYLCYFDKVTIESNYKNNKHRSFIFDENFNNSSTISDVNDSETWTELTLQEFNGVRLKRNHNINAKFIKNILLENFYMKFYNAKSKGKDIKVTIDTMISGKEDNETISVSDLPNFKWYSVDVQGIDLFDNIGVYYYIAKSENPLRPSTFITALSVDDRSMPIDVIADENKNTGYDMIFLLKSESLQGSSDESRQTLKIEEGRLNILKQIFRNAIRQIVRSEVPVIAETNDRQVAAMENRYPHLSGLIDRDNVGYLSYTEVVKRAQERFFKEERELLGATSLSDEQYKKSIEFSSRSLALYIIYRQKLIEKLSTLNHDTLETDLHSLISKRFQKFEGADMEKDVYLNNLWVIDDKFMSYEYTLSEKNITDVIRILDPNYNGDKNTDRPDIAIFFSSDPSVEDHKFDIVIVELKRLGIKPEMNAVVEYQLEKRTIQLSKYYHNRIQRIWYYGIVEMDEEYMLHLENTGYKPIFSLGNIWFQHREIKPSRDSMDVVIQNSYIMDFKALVDDARSRNSTFLRILREKFATDSPI
ncbi:MAG: hypothetical protein HDR09_18275 [Lachnospiraceae bacterium]|nr:hypothetical protein [Lachnospiraceae bacterium]